MLGLNLINTSSGDNLSSLNNQEGKRIFCVTTGEKHSLIGDMINASMYDNDFGGFIGDMKCRDYLSACDRLYSMYKSDKLCISLLAKYSAFVFYDALYELINVRYKENQYKQDKLGKLFEIKNDQKYINYFNDYESCSMYKYLSQIAKNIASGCCYSDSLLFDSIIICANALIYNHNDQETINVLKFALTKIGDKQASDIARSCGNQNITNVINKYL